MADPNTPNLAGANEAWNDFIKGLDAMVAAMLAGLEVDASTLASTMSSHFTSLITELRDFMPELPALPNINLQAELTSLAGLTIGSDKYNTLLSSITSSFDDELTASGYTLSELVTKTRTAIDAGETLSGVVPNFVKDAAGLADAFQIAAAVKQATEDSVPEEAPSYTPNDSLLTLQEALSDAADAAKKVTEEVIIFLADGTTKVTKKITSDTYTVTTTEV